MKFSTIGFYCLIAFIMVATLSSFSYQKDVLVDTDFNFLKELYNPPNHTKMFLTGLEINDYISNRPKEDFIAFYNTYTRNEHISRAIINNAIAKKMPINLAMALCKIESGYDPKAINKNVNGSIDRGLFQLNNASRKHWKVIDFYNIDKNVEEGIRFWSEECMPKVKSTPISFIAYNMGPFSKGVKNNFIPDHRKRYVEDILAYEDALNVEFNKFIRGENVLYQ